MYAKKTMAEIPPEQLRRRPKHPANVSGASDQQPRSAVIAFALLMAGAAAAIFLAGGAEQGNLGAFLLCAGIAMIACPPLVPVRLGVAVAAGATFLCSAGALLPARFFPVSVWRQALAAVPDLPLPGTVSAAPSQTVFWLAILLVTLLTGLFMFTQPVRSRPLFGLALAGVSVCGVYAALSIFAKLTGWNYPFSAGATFGFLPNRNHTATLLVTGSVLAIGVTLMAFRERRWLAVDTGVAALAFSVAGLCYFSESRAGVLFLLVGVVGWVLGLGARHRNRPVLLAVAVTAIIAAGLFFSLKSEVRDRLLGLKTPSVQTTRVADSAAEPQERPAGETTTEDRLRIYRDTLGMIRDAPLTGVGLGTFSLVFPPYRKASINLNLILHPESDWLMWTAEAGIPSLVALGALIWLALRGWRPSREHPHWPVRSAFFAAAAAAALHGSIDVPAHRAAVGWWTLILAGLALQPGRVMEPLARPSLGMAISRTTFILGGLLSLVLGGTLLRAEWFGGAPLPPYAASAAEKSITRQMSSGDRERTLEFAREAVRVSPLYPPLYYRLGVALLNFEGTDAEAMCAFHIQRVLNPFDPGIVRTQAVGWMSINPAFAAERFSEALQRQERLLRVGASQESATSYFGDLVALAGSSPDTQRALWEPAIARGSSFILVWLENATPEVAREKLAEATRNTALLQGFTANEQLRFLRVLETKGGASIRERFERAQPGIKQENE